MKLVGEVKLDTIQSAMIRQLQLKGADTPYFMDMVERYMTLWHVAIDLEEDIRKRRVVYKDKSSVGVDMWKNNPSVSELVKVTTQMSKLLTQMNLTVDNVLSESESDEL